MSQGNTAHKQTVPVPSVKVVERLPSNANTECMLGWTLCILIWFASTQTGPVSSEQQWTLAGWNWEVCYVNTRILTQQTMGLITHGCGAAHYQDKMSSAANIFQCIMIEYQFRYAKQLRRALQTTWTWGWWLCDECNISNLAIKQQVGPSSPRLVSCFTRCLRD